MNEWVNYVNIHLLELIINNIVCLTKLIVRICIEWPIKIQDFDLMGAGGFLQPIFPVIFNSNNFGILLKNIALSPTVQPETLVGLVHSYPLIQSGK